ncbi:MAG: TIR domain-containing protein [Alphaproteobacteria bacterium]|nr:TIR domain-containing protein [Alphaproteobacteria bacterium]
MSDIFVSYARSTAAQARAVSDALRALGYSVWRDDELPTHRAYGDVIEEQLAQAKAVVVIWSAEAVRSEWVRSEADRARGERKLVQLSIDTARLPMPFDQIQCADLSGWSGDTNHPGWQKTLASIVHLAGAPTAPAKHAPPAAAEPERGNLPRRHGALIGREAELAQIGKLLESGDLVTITGTGGVGKTRIALEFAHKHADAYEDAAWLVELAPVTEPSEVPLVIGRALGIELPPGPNALDALMQRLRPRQTLIVLDNCEHVIDAVAAVAEAALDHAPRVKLLASSQEPLGLEGERVFRLRSLGEADAATLFVERARGADAAWSPKAGDDTAIATICQRLDGIPLALEMAAARAPALGCAAVLQRLDDRFRILTGGKRTALPRQRTLQATLDWSHGLLSAADAAVFRRLGVFTAGFTLEAASKVAAGDKLDEFAVIDAVASLVAKSLVLADTEGSQTRYRLLETTRMYALEQLAAANETQATQRSHAAYFASFVAPAAAHYRSPMSDEEFYDRYAPDTPNIEKALSWAFGRDGDSEIGIAMTGDSWAIWPALSTNGRYLPWSDIALERCGPQTPAQLVFTLKRSVATAWNYSGRPVAGAALAEELLPTLRARADSETNKFTLLDTLNALQTALNLQGLQEKARAYADEIYNLAATLPPSRGTIGAMLAHAGSRYLEQPEATLERLRQIEQQAREIKANGWATLVAENRVNSTPSDPDSAIAETREVLAGIRPKHMFVAGTTAALYWTLAYYLARRNAPGDLDEAWGFVRGVEKLLGQRINGRFTQAYVMLAVRDGRPADGARLLGCCSALAQRIGINFWASQRNEALSRELLREHLSDAQIDALGEEGARLSEASAFDLATTRQTAQG